MSFSDLLLAASPRTHAITLNGAKITLRGLTGLEGERHMLALIELSESDVQQVMENSEGGDPDDMDTADVAAQFVSHRDAIRVMGEARSDLNKVRRDLICDCITAVNDQPVKMSDAERATFVETMGDEFGGKAWELIERLSGAHDDALGDATKN